MIAGHNNWSDTNTLGYDWGIPHPENVAAFALKAQLWPKSAISLRAQRVRFDMGCGISAFSSISLGMDEGYVLAAVDLREPWPEIHWGATPAVGLEELQVTWCHMAGSEARTPAAEFQIPRGRWTNTVMTLPPSPTQGFDSQSVVTPVGHGPLRCCRFRFRAHGGRRGFGWWIHDYLMVNYEEFKVMIVIIGIISK